MEHVTVLALGNLFKMSPGVALLGGGIGFIGGALGRALKNKGYTVKIISRLSLRPLLSWGAIEAHGLPENCTALINTAGQNVFDTRKSWTEGFKEDMCASRVRTTSILAKAVSDATTKPTDFLSKPTKRTKLGQQVGEGLQWVPFYRFKQVVLARAIQKMKIYQTIFSVIIMLPLSLYGIFHQIIPNSAAALALGGAVFTCGMLFVAGKLSSTVIGFMYFSKADPELIKVAHLDFWGNRVDTIVQVVDIVPISDLFVRTNDRFFPLKRYSDEKGEHPYYFSFQHGFILDIDEFERVFGNIPEQLRDMVIEKRKEYLKQAAIEKQKAEMKAFQKR